MKIFVILKLVFGIEAILWVNTFKFLVEIKLALNVVNTSIGINQVFFQSSSILR